MNLVKAYSTSDGEVLLLFAPKWNGSKVACKWWLSYTQINNETPVIISQGLYKLEKPILETHLLKNESITLNYHGSI
jgi:hypothetical protein